MRINTTYTCEICGASYTKEAKAMECESTVRIPKPCVKGDKIYVYPRYEKAQLDTVVNCDEYKHGWIIETEHAWQYSKDGFDIKSFYIDSIEETKQLTEIN